MFLSAESYVIDLLEFWSTCTEIHHILVDIRNIVLGKGNSSKTTVSQTTQILNHVTCLSSQGKLEVRAPYCSVNFVIVLTFNTFVLF